MVMKPADSQRFAEAVQKLNEFYQHAVTSSDRNSDYVAYMAIWCQLQVERMSKVADGQASEIISDLGTDELWALDKLTQVLEKDDISALAIDPEMVRGLAKQRLVELKNRFTADVAQEKAEQKEAFSEEEVKRAEVAIKQIASRGLPMQGGVVAPGDENKKPT